MITLKKYLAAIALLATATASNAQLKEGKKNIEKLCGCFDVDFRYAETFSADTAYKFHEREQLAGRELVIPIETSDKKIVLQHLLQVNDTFIVKHWREDWVYEQPTLLQYQGNKQWTKQLLATADVKNKWVQTVWEVDDAPRYQGISQWINTDGKTFWQNTTNAPLPRREYTHRKDYNVLKRGNRVVVTDSAWWHEQDNLKVVKTGEAEKVLAEEKGMNYYTRIADSKCAKAKEWWVANGGFWTLVRAEWDSYVKIHAAVNLKAKVDNKRLDQLFEDLWNQWNAKAITPEAVSAKARIIVQQFAGDANVAAR